MDNAFTGMILLLGHFLLIYILIILFLRKKSVWESPRLYSLIFHPLVIFLIAYFFWIDTFYISIIFVNPAELVGAPIELLDYSPTITLILIYHVGALSVIIGYYYSGKIVSIIRGILQRIRDWIKSDPYFIILIDGIRSIWIRIDHIFFQVSNSWISRSRWEKRVFNLCIMIWVLSFGCSFLILWQIDGIPLFNIELRSEINPFLMTFSLFQVVIIIPFAMLFNQTSPAINRRLLLLIIAIAFSIVIMSLLGARNLPLKIIGPAILVLLWSKRTKVPTFFIFLLFVIGMIISVAVVGYLSKTQLYGRESLSLTETIVELIFSDVGGNLRYFDIVIEESDTPLGHFYGTLFIKTIISFIPGSDEYYANYHIAELVGFDIDRRLVSIGSTINGPAYAELGWLGVFIQGLSIGVIIGYGWRKAKQNEINMALFAIFFAPLVLTMELGMYGLGTWITFIIMMLGFWMMNLRNKSYLKKYFHPFYRKHMISDEFREKEGSDF